MTWWGELLGCLAFAGVVALFAFGVEWIKKGGDR